MIGLLQAIRLWMLLGRFAFAATGPRPRTLESSVLEPLLEPMETFHVERINLTERDYFEIIYMKKFFDSDWLRALQFKCNTKAKSVTPV